MMSVKITCGVGMIIVTLLLDGMSKQIVAMMQKLGILNIVQRQILVLQTKGIVIPMMNVKLDCFAILQMIAHLGLDLLLAQIVVNQP